MHDPLQASSLHLALQLVFVSSQDLTQVALVRAAWLMVGFSTLAVQPAIQNPNATANDVRINGRLVMHALLV